MKPHLYAQRSAADDGLAINSTTLHQYYSTVQAEVHPHDELDDILDQRRIQSLVKRHNRSRRNFRLIWWTAGLVVIAAYAAAQWV